MAEVQAASVLAFLVGTGPVARDWHRKRLVLVSLYRFAISRGDTHQELRRLLEATSRCELPRAAQLGHVQFERRTEASA